MTIRDEGGATAAITALLAVVLVSTAGLAVDLGNAFVRKRDTQAQADFAALAGAATPGLPAPSLTPAAEHEAVRAVAQYLMKNQPQDDRCGDPCRTEAQLRSDLTDKSDGNGEVYYGTWDAADVFQPSTYALTVRTPPAYVRFGLAAVMGYSSTEVQAVASVATGSPSPGAVMPFYAYGGGTSCDYGARVLTDPANGKVQTTAPSLASPTTSPTDGSNATLQSVSVTTFELGDTTTTFTINGSQLASVGRVGYFRTPTEAPNVSEVVLATENTNNNSISGLRLPSLVAGTEGVWHIRVLKTSGNKGWSPVAQALPIRVGEPQVEFGDCPTSSNSGNFGALKLPRSAPDNSASWLPLNTAVGTKTPLTLAVHPAPNPDGTCTVGATGTVYSTTTGVPTLLEGTNCISTDTGLPANGVTQGLVTGYGSEAGRLTRQPTAVDPQDSSKGCAPDRSQGAAVVLGKSLNNDRLSCFMTTNAKLGTIGSPLYSGPPVLTPDIYNSPRFLWVPVVSKDPAKGRSLTYAITGFRPAFITSETADSSHDSPVVSDSSNGLTVTGNRVTTLRVFFFHDRALPTVSNSVVGPYLGVGPRVVRLVN